MSEKQESDDELLLSDVNDALHRIVSSPSPSELVGDGHDDEYKGPPRDITLSSKQLISLRNLERRIRQSLANQQRKAQRGFRKVITGDENRRVRDAARSSMQRTSHVVTKRVRKVVTGSSEKTLQEWLKDAKVVKTVGE